MILATPKPAYDMADEAKTRAAIAAAIAKAYVRGESIELWPGATVILRSPNNNRWKLAVDNAGALTAVAA
jgi:hypothetical protein